MEATSTTPSATTGTSSARPAQAAPRSSASITSDFDTFLRLLTVQLRNQDPLNPMESQEFAVQLATFSGVEQQVRTNDLLSDVAGRLGASGLADFAGWIGQEVRTSGAAAFDGTPLELAPTGNAPTGTSSMLVVRDATGKAVARSPVSQGATDLTWAGVREDGTPFSTGLYSFEIEDLQGESVIGTRKVEHYSRVTEVRSDDTGATLVLDGGATVKASDVTGIRPVADP